MKRTVATQSKAKYIVAIALILVMLMTSSFVMMKLGVDVRSYIDTDRARQNLQVDTNTFVDMRSSTSLTQEQFEQMEYQKNESNFEHIAASEIGGLVDSRHGVTLQEESEAIQVNKNNANEIVGNKITDTSTLTIMTYGQGGALSHWSNKGSLGITSDKGELLYDDFTYDKDSMIEYLRRKSNADVYIAKTFFTNVWSGKNSDFSIGLQNKGLSLYKLDSNVVSYENYNPNKVEPYTDITQIQDYTKHNIILFDSNSSNQYHNFVYNELNIILTQLSYDYLLNIGQVPKVSMISHSTGGIWNMMWANRHPLNVDQLIAIAAPFNGTAMGHILYYDWNRLSTALFGLFNPLESLRGSVTNPSGLNNVDGDRYEQLNLDWEYAVGVNSSLRVFAITGPTSLDLLTYDLLGVSEWETAVLMVFMLGILAEVIAEILFLAAAAILSIIIPIPLLALIAIIGAVAIVVTIANLIYAYGNIISYMLSSLYVDKNGEVAMYDDFIVDSSSALGKQDNDTVLGNPNEYLYRETYDYSNFSYLEKTFRPDNCDINKLNLKNFAVGHNLEVQDSDIIQDVGANIVMDKPDTRYDYTVLADKTVRIDGVKDEYYNERVVLPEVIDGMPVVSVASGAMQNDTVLSSLTVGSNVRVVEASAFEGTGLTSLNLDNADNLKEIGSRAFQSVSIDSVVLPSGLNVVGDNAFANSRLLDRVSGGDGLVKVGANVFENTPWVDSATTNCVLGQVLIKYRSSDIEFKIDNKSGIKYFASSAFEGSVLERIDVSGFDFGDKDNIDTETGIAVKILPNYFLYGASNLVSVKLPNDINMVGISAFEGTSRLSDLEFGEYLGAIGSRAFANSGIATLSIGVGYPPSIAGDTFLGVNTNNLKVYVKHYAQELYANEWGADKGILFVSKEGALLFYDSDMITELYRLDIFYYFDYLENIDWMQNGFMTKAGYSFDGWFDCDGNKYVSGQLWDKEFVANNAWILYARWSENYYNIGYQQDGGKSSNPDYVTINDVVILQDSVKEGYIFDGWYDNAGFVGSPLDRLSGVSQDMVLYAKFIAIQTEIVFSTVYDSGINGTRMIVSYDERFLAPIPTRENYAFAGWYTTLDDSNGRGDRITGTNGYSGNGSKFLGTVTLYARWTQKSFVIEFEDGNNSYVLGGDGLTSDAGSVLAGDKIDVNSEEFKDIFRRDGYIFSHFEDSFGNLIDFTNGVPDLGENYGTFVIHAVLIPEKYTVTLYDDSSQVYKTVVITYDDFYDLSISKLGHDFNGWFDEYGNLIFENMQGIVLVDFTVGEGDGSVSLYARFSASQGNVTFDTDGGSFVSGINVVYGEYVPNISIPTKDGYKFLGFYDSIGIAYIDEYGNGIMIWDKTDTFVELKAKWELEEYTLTYVYNDYDDSTAQLKYSAIDTKALQTAGNLSYNKVGYTFNGWFIDDQFNGYAILSTSGLYSNITVYAKWTINTSQSLNGQTPTISSDNAVFNLAAYTSYNYYIVTLSASVNNILIYGTAVVRFSFTGGATVLNIYLQAAVWTSASGYSGISKTSGTLNVFAVYGTSNITGADGAIGDTGTGERHGTGHGSPSNGSPRADGGSNGDNGGNGGNGMYAISANNTIIGGKYSLTLKGGNGGVGGKGGTGGNGAYGNDGQQGGGKDNGVAGGHGATGGNGGNGGNGATAINGNRTVNNSSVTITDGSGGVGGEGGKGGDGGRGGKGANLKVFSNSAGKGGAGGNGGKGGNGGAGGYSPSGTQASTGKGGNGGNAGSGGNGGSGVFGNDGGSAGSKGQAGSGSPNGNDGNDGSNGNHG